MMGERRVAQETLFHGFSLERPVPADHWVRAIDRFVDLSDIALIYVRSTARWAGPNGARDEFLLAAAAQNLRNLAKLLPNDPQVRPV